MTTVNSTLSKACVILGAGASHDVWDSGTTVINGDFKPPLAKDLFNIEKHRAYQAILSEYPGAHFLAQPLASRISSGVLSVEEALRSFAYHENDLTRERFKHVPAYLRDLIYRASNDYVDIPSCYIQLSQSLMADSPHQVLYITLNYDDLLEKALLRFDQSLMFSDMADYIAEGRQAKVVKIHGSIDWFRPLIGRGADWENIVSRSNVIQKPNTDEIFAQSPVGQVKGAERHGNAIYPVITAPLAGKGPDDVVCPDSHLDYARQFLAECRKFLIIGTSGLDDDLLEILETSIPPNSRPFVHFVGVGDLGAVSDRFFQHVQAFERISKELTGRFSNGFRSYVSGEEVRAFAEFRHS